MATPLEPGDMLPSRRIEPLSSGSAVRVGSNRARSQVLVVTHADPCEECESYLASFQAVTDDVKAEKAEVLALVGAEWKPLPLEVPVIALVDDGVLGSRLSSDGTPVVAVADRYGQLFTRYDAGADHDFPEHDKVLRLLLDIAIRCPECGVPDIPTGLTLPEAGTKSGGIHAHQ
ncbi:MAG: hypothetical protein M3179_14735 [Actinomycetota bacterium]|nr:hypothetical protein [Actinomycetota bacterium]